MTDDITIGEADDETVFGCVVFVFGLSDEALAGVVVGLTSTTTLVLGLEAAVVLSASPGRSGEDDRK